MEERAHDREDLVLQAGEDVLVLGAVPVELRHVVIEVGVTVLRPRAANAHQTAERPRRPEAEGRRRRLLHRPQLTAMFAPLIVGLAGTSLIPFERDYLAAVKPFGIIVFARNIEGKNKNNVRRQFLKSIEKTIFLSLSLYFSLLV